MDKLKLNDMSIGNFIKFLNSKYYLTIKHTLYDCGCCGIDKIEVIKDIKDKSLIELLDEYYMWEKRYEK